MKNIFPSFKRTLFKTDIYGSPSFSIRQVENMLYP